MKKISLFLLCFLYTSFLFSIEETLNPDCNLTQKLLTESKEGRLFFFSYPRSGTHWTRYILRGITHRVLTIQSTMKPAEAHKHFPTDLSKPPIHSMHFYYPDLLKSASIHLPDMQKDKILIVIRNPLECIIRRFVYAKSTDLNVIPSVLETKGFKLYETLDFFEKWPKKNRLVVYYENLIQYPQREMERILEFLEAPKTYLADFIDNLEEHKRISLEHYLNKGGSYTTGNYVPTFHQDQVPLRLNKEIKSTIYKENPKLFKKYMDWYFQE